jgi:alcohol dehydrogenase class IV
VKLRAEEDIDLKEVKVDALIYSMWPGETYFGNGAAGEVGRHARRLDSNRSFVVTDRGVREAGLLDRVLTSLGKECIESVVFDEVEPNPSDRLVRLATERFKDSGANLLVAVGGGSPMDTAKAVRLVAAGGGDILEYDLGLGERAKPTPRNMPPLIAIPTTSGTGSEVTAWAVITDTQRNFKISVGDAPLIPTIALVDPEMTVTMPPSLTAATGIDALSHCIESYVSTHEHPLGDLLALFGIRLVARSLKRAVANGRDKEARRDMVMAAMVGGMSLNLKWGGACHSLAHQLSTELGLPHGVSISLMLPHQMEYSLSASLEKYAQVAEAMGKGKGIGSLEEKAVEAVTAVRELIRDIGLPTRLRDVGVKEEMIPAMARKAIKDDSHMTNPRKCTEEVMEELYWKAY